MYLFWWFILGGALAAAIIPAATGPDRPQEGRFIRGARDFFGLPREPAPYNYHADDHDRQRLWWLLVKRLILVGVILLLLVIAIGIDTASLPEWLISLRSLVLGPHVQAFAAGALVGWLLKRHLDGVRVQAQQIFDATIGNKTTGAWALQGTLAIAIVALTVYLIKPDLLRSLRTVEYNGVKVTLNEAAPVRSANLNYKELLFDTTLEQYEDLYGSYITVESDRGTASRWVRDGDLDRLRNELTKTLDPPYIRPVMQALICLGNNGALHLAAHDSSLSVYAARWQTFVMRLLGRPDRLSADEVGPFLTEISYLRRKILKLAARMLPACAPAEATLYATPDSEGAALKVASIYRDAQPLLQPAAGRKLPSLLLLEPYLISALSDLIALLRDQEAKAEFLAQVLDGFERSDDMLTPGIINLFYQVADAQLRSSDNWPFDRVLFEIDYALRGVSLLVIRSHDKIEQAKRAEAGPEKVREDGSVADIIELRIHDLFQRNRVILLSEKLFLFNQRILAGEHLTEAQRQDWLAAFAEIIAIMRARKSAPVVMTESAAKLPLDPSTAQAWERTMIEPEFLLDAAISIALSSILIEESSETEQASALACNTANYFLREARGLSELVQREREEKTSGALFPQHVVYRLKLDRIRTVIANRVGASCGWTSD